MFLLKVTGPDSQAYLKDGIAWVGPYESAELAQNGADRINSCNPDDYTGEVLPIGEMGGQYCVDGMDKKGMTGHLPGEFLSEFYFTHCW